MSQSSKEESRHAEGCCRRGCSGCCRVKEARMFPQWVQSRRGGDSRRRIGSACRFCGFLDNSRLAVRFVFNPCRRFHSAAKTPQAEKRCRCSACMHWRPANHSHIPPSIEEQAGIVGKLDCWEELTREIESRQSRFGHYLDKLVD
ncbi:MAG: hypothetical protein OXD45_15285 [Rhodobacteraceae bacterium]|nr:hypothetical protein [Paracoccaceae bacterium]